MGVVFSDFGRAKLASGITAGTTAPFTMNLDDGTKFKAYGAGEYEYLVLKDTSLNREIIKVTARTGNAFTVSQRAIGPTTARDWSIGDLCEAALTAEALADFLKDTPLTGTTTIESVNVSGNFTGDGNASFSKAVAAAYYSLYIANLDETGFVRYLFFVGSGGTQKEADISYAPGIFFAMGPAINDTDTPIVFRNNNATEQLRIGVSGQLGIGGANYGTAAVGAKQSITSGGASAAPSWRTNCQWEIVWSGSSISIDTTGWIDGEYSVVDTSSNQWRVSIDRNLVGSGNNLSSHERSLIPEAGVFSSSFVRWQLNTERITGANQETNISTGSVVSNTSIIFAQVSRLT